MNERQHRRRRERVTHIYALLLRLYPRAHRQAFGEPMLQTFRNQYRFNALGGRIACFGLSDLGSSFINQAFGLWLLGFVAVLALALVTTRFTPARPAVVPVSD